MFNKKYTKLVVAMGIMLSAGAAQAVPVELTTNGGFETGDFTGWTLFPSAFGPASVQSTTVSSGSFAAYLPCSTPNACDQVIKNANIGIGVVNPFDTVHVSFDLNNTAGAGGVAFVELFSELSGGGTSKSELLLVNATGTTGWQTFAFDAVLGGDVSGGITLQLKAACGAVAGCTSEAYFDNVSVTADVPAVPVPAAVWLFGSGLLGLVGVARRKRSC
jgi:hypothetical protein